MTPFISGEFTVSDIKRANYSELFPSDEESADRWFKCKLIFITLDEKSGAEKKTSTQVLVHRTTNGTLDLDHVTVHALQGNALELVCGTITIEDGEYTSDVGPVSYTHLDPFSAAVNTISNPPGEYDRKVETQRN